MLSFLAVLLPFFPIILCDVFTRDDCWCRNATHLGWKRHFELDGVNIEGDPLIMDQWCFQATHDGRGKCLDWHTIQYRVCASHQAAHNASRRNDFCYYNHGNFRGAVTLWSKGDDAIKWNDHIRNVPFKSPPVPMSVEESIRYCEPVCRDFHGWNLRVMDPWSPSKHGVVESRHQVFNDITDFPFEDGVAGEWPYKSPTHKSPGEFSTTQNGIIDYWVIDFEHEGSGLDPIGHGGSLSWKHAKVWSIAG